MTLKDCCQSVTGRGDGLTAACCDKVSAALTSVSDALAAIAKAVTGLGGTAGTGGGSPPGPSPDAKLIQQALRDLQDCICPELEAIHAGIGNPPMIPPFKVPPAPEVPEYQPPTPASAAATANQYLDVVASQFTKATV